MPKGCLMDETQRIKEAYKRRAIHAGRRKKSKDKYPYFFSRQREIEIIRAISKTGLGPIINKNILDVGCGSGNILGYFLQCDVLSENLFGIDLLCVRIDEARRLYPKMSFWCGSAESLPYCDRFFDIIIQSTMFTSILDSTMKKKIADEMLRVLKPDGIIIWHDYRFNNPLNKDVKGIRKKEIIELFDHCHFSFKLMNLNPLIARPLSQLSWKLCEFFEKVIFLRTHWLVTIKKRG